MNKLRRRLYNFAYSSRLWAEKKSSYNTYLCGMCARSSANLYKRLKRYRFNPKIHCSRVGYGGHVFLSCSGYIIDVTATQFDSSYPKVLIYKSSSKFVESIHVGLQISFKCLRDFRWWQYRMCWPKDQMVTCDE